MDAFASIALSTAPAWRTHNRRPDPPAIAPSQHLGSFRENLERPAKRARLEKMPSPELHRGQSNMAPRPVAGYEASADSRIMDAELLVNFSLQAARMSVPAPVAPYKFSSPGTGYRGPVSDPKDPHSMRPTGQREEQHPIKRDLESQTRHNIVSNPREHPLARPVSRKEQQHSTDHNVEPQARRNMILDPKEYPSTWPIVQKEQQHPIDRALESQIRQDIISYPRDRPSARPTEQKEQQHPIDYDVESQTPLSKDILPQALARSEPRPRERSHDLIVTKTRGTSPPKTSPLDFREQLIEASKSSQQQAGPSSVAESVPLIRTVHQPQQTANDSPLALEDDHLDGASVPQDGGASGADVEKCVVESISSIHTVHQPQRTANDPPLALEDDYIDGASAPQEEDAVGANVEKPSVDATDRSSFVYGSRSSDNDAGEDTIQVPTTGYWPSMLATTIEQTASAWRNRLTQALAEFAPATQQSIPDTGAQPKAAPVIGKGAHVQEPATCAACKFMRNIMSGEVDGESASWISCDGCKCWFHFACAGFKSEREVRSVDKYRCRSCKAIHGPTTYVRKSSRAHTAIDYAGLNQGVVKTSDERPEHHYIKPIREGTITLQPENFARIRPELATAEYFEKGHGMKEPVVIPAEWNPRPKPVGTANGALGSDSEAAHENQDQTTQLEDWFARDPDCRHVLDHGQDALDMVIPPDLTVRKVAELYGPEEKVEVIDVKSQNGEGKKWNMRRWADYYESTTNKVVRNVISLEVSQSTLGRLIKRPQIVRDLDLQDSVWPAELQAKGEFPHVQFYCLMSVADCFTDFHIDFGGSSVFYHILKGKKTFFFIPPKEKHLKKYEEWCMSPAQNWTFLGDQTKECYRVDLSEGDTMLIPAGWIHAVWTPEDSLVIGGNFLTRLNYSMQLRIAQIEKATGVARKFRYPHFQKIQWYTAIRYLENDPVPSHVRSELQTGGIFHRQYPAYHDFDAWGENSRSGPENYHARYYSQPELEGLPDLVRYLLRTALIDAGDISEGITAEARNAVKKSIPRGFGEPLEIVKNFAIWCAWKRGNEPIPHWAHPDAAPEIRTADTAAKMSAAALKKLDLEQTPRRQSSRNQVQQPLNFGKELDTLGALESDIFGSFDLLHPLADGNSQQKSRPRSSANARKRKTAPGEVIASHRKTACESCRRRRRACKHKSDQQQPKDQTTLQLVPSTGDTHQVFAGPSLATEESPSEIPIDPQLQGLAYASDANQEPESHQQVLPLFHNTESISMIQADPGTEGIDSADGTVHTLPRNMQVDLAPQEFQKQQAAPKPQKTPRQKSSTKPPPKGRSKACNECRKSKVSCHGPLMLTRCSLHSSGAAFTMRMGKKILSRFGKQQHPDQQVETNGAKSSTIRKTVCRWILSCWNVLMRYLVLVMHRQSLILFSNALLWQP